MDDIDDKGTDYNMVWYNDDSVDIMVPDLLSVITSVNTSGWWDDPAPYDEKIYEGDGNPYFCRRFTWAFDFSTTQNVVSSDYFIKIYRDALPPVTTTTEDSYTGDGNPYLPNFKVPEIEEENSFTDTLIKITPVLLLGLIIVFFWIKNKLNNKMGRKAKGARKKIKNRNRPKFK